MKKSEPQSRLSARVGAAPLAPDPPKLGMQRHRLRFEHIPETDGPEKLPNAPLPGSRRGY